MKVESEFLSTELWSSEKLEAEKKNRKLDTNIANPWDGKW